MGYSLILSALAIARYDSRDGHQWHPRELIYRKASRAAVAEDDCRNDKEDPSFALAVDLDDDDDDDEHHRKWLLGGGAKDPYVHAKISLPERVVNARERHDAEEQMAADLAQQAAEAAEEAADNEDGHAYEPDAPDQSDESYGGDNSDSDDEQDGSGGGSGSGSDGYTGPRCYAPGGKTYRPC